jgi:hypothetical protein
MPWFKSLSAEWVDKEVLKFPTGLHAIKSVVLDATDLASWTVSTTDGARYVVPAGTILKLSTTNPTQYVEYAGGEAGTIKGILARPIDLVANATLADEPAPMFFFDCVFATSAIVGFTLYASALVTDLNHCAFE